MATLRNVEEVRESWGQAKAHDPFGNTCMSMSFWDSSLPHMWVFMENVFVSALSVWDHFVWFTTRTGPEDREDLIFHFLSLLGYHKLNTDCSKTWIVLQILRQSKQISKRKWREWDSLQITDIYCLMYIHTLFVSPQRVMRLLNCVYYYILFLLLTFIFGTVTEMMHIWLDTHMKTPLDLAYGISP